MRWTEDAAPPPGLTIPKGDFWVFGYGSLMWDPGFPHEALERGHVAGWQRSFCVRCQGHRGTVDQPGLVVALRPGGECHGVAIKVAAAHKGSTLAYLWDREMILADGYQPRTVTVTLTNGSKVEALTFVADLAHPAYAGSLSPSEAARRIHRAKGARGSNRDYFNRTIDRLTAFGVHDPALAPLQQAMAAVGG